ncbi:small ribosomal subunit protein bS6m-like [Montipora foliosa]|uniref:small ribosomal subunit protein bS6m-like n=1 Tax=Montipora foliosa TaxID=591990 RepID=UPI0035F14332
MPQYELSLITRVLSKEGYASVLRRTALSIMDRGGVVRKMENLGEQELPHRMRAHTEWHSHGRYFLFHFDLGPEGIKELKHELDTDVDLIRPRMVYVKSRYDSQKHGHNMLECWESYKPPHSSFTT